MALHDLSQAELDRAASLVGRRAGVEPVAEGIQRELQVSHLAVVLGLLGLEFFAGMRVCDACQVLLVSWMRAASVPFSDCMRSAA